MNKRKKTAEQAAAELKHMMVVAAGFVHERFPDVASINADCDFVDADKPGQAATKKNYSWTPESPASFEVGCCYRECVKGGFNLNAPIKTMLAEKASNISGESRCQGWEDHERVGRFHCTGKLLFRVTVKYL